jgi:hypothetical protein
MRTILLGAVAAIALGTGAMAQNNQGGGGSQGGGAQAQPPIMNNQGPAGAGNRQPMGGDAATPRAARPDGMRGDNAAQRQQMDQGGQRQGQAAEGEPAQRRLNTGEAGDQGGQRREKAAEGQPDQRRPNQAAGQGNERPTASGNVGSRTRINITAPRQKTVIKSNIVRTNVTVPAGVTIAVGTVLPSTIAFQPVPAAIVAEVPALEPYYYVVVDGQVVFVDPGTYEIVYVMPLA